MKVVDSDKKYMTEREYMKQKTKKRCIEPKVTLPPASTQLGQEIK